ncbi:hypothetical protein KAH55_13805 [bacterium]|nr:hypothetical protein [bacterium]
MKIDRDWLLSGARTEAEKYFNPKTGICIIPRETAWYAITLLVSKRVADQQLGNRLLQQLVFTDGTHSPATLFVIFKTLARQLEPSTKEHLLGQIAVNLPISATVRYSDGNVNHPLAAYVNLICGGELVNQPAYVRLGRDLLLQFQQAISKQHAEKRQAEMAEYNSPTYTALTLWFLAIIGEYATDTVSRCLALQLEQGLWQSVALQWHEPTQQFCGPFSRAYTEDSVGGFSALHCTFGFALEKDVFLAPELVYQFEHPSALIENALIAQLTFHVPDSARQIFSSDIWPRSVRKTTYCEQYHENLKTNRGSTFDPEVYPGGWGELTSFLTTDFCLGTASRPYVNAAQTDSFSLRYRRVAKVASLVDFRGAFSRLVFNGAVAGQTNFCHSANFDVGPDYLYEEGRVFTCQYQNQAIVACSPKRAGAGKISEIRLDLIFSYFTTFDQVYVNKRSVAGFPFDSPIPERITIFDGPIQLTVVPLQVDGLGGFVPKCHLWTKNGFFMISFYNYLGPEIKVTRDEISRLRNGFAVRIDAATSPTREMKLYESLQPPFNRHIGLKCGTDRLILVYDPLAERVLERSFNGESLAVNFLEIELPVGADKVLKPERFY